MLKVPLALFAVSMRSGSSTRFIEFLLPGAGYKADDEIWINVMMMIQWIFAENQFSSGRWTRESAQPERWKTKRPDPINRPRTQMNRTPNSRKNAVPKPKQ